MKVIHVTKENYENEVVRADRKVLLDFWAPWCGPCRMVGPLLDELAEERTDIKVCKVNVDEEPELARQFRIFSIPTLMVVEQGKVSQKKVGAMTRDQLNAML